MREGQGLKQKSPKKAASSGGFFYALRREAFFCNTIGEY